MNVFPEPKTMLLQQNNLPMPAHVTWALDLPLTIALAERKCSLQFVEDAFSGNSGVSLVVDAAQNAALQAEGYCLTLTPAAAHVQYSTPAGFYYAMCTLAQLAKAHAWHTGRIEDAPALAMRGVMIDIGRDKIPTMETLYAYVDFFAALKYNQMQLYMEGFCFDYTKYHYLFSDSTPITGEEFDALSQYAAGKFVDLVPNQNCLGHMDQWLAKPQMKNLAECPDGFLHQNLYWRAPMTLDVKDEKAFALVQYFLTELLPHTQGEYVNVNMDEPFELGIGKNKEECEKFGVGKLYLDYILKIRTLCQAFDKKIMIWGDVIFNHPEMIAQLPEDIVLLDWIYEGDASFESHCLALQKAKCAWCLCPGSSSWTSFAGRSDNMVKNINDAVQNAVRYHGKGVMITDWGDLGHWQYSTISQPAFVCAGQAMWSGKPIALDAVRTYCNTVVFEDLNGKMFDLLYNLGNYYQLEHAPLYNTTLCFAMMSTKYPFDNREQFAPAVERLLALCRNIAKENHIVCETNEIHLDADAIEHLLQETRTLLDETRLCGKYGALMKREVENTIALIRHGLHLYLLMTQPKTENYADEMNAQYADLCAILPRHFDLWMARNRRGGFAKSTAQLQHLLTVYAHEAAMEV